MELPQETPEVVGTSKVINTYGVYGEVELLEPTVVVTTNIDKVTCSIFLIDMNAMIVLFYLRLRRLCRKIIVE